MTGRVQHTCSLSGLGRLLIVVYGVLCLCVVVLPRLLQQQSPFRLNPFDPKEAGRVLEEIVIATEAAEEHIQRRLAETGKEASELFGKHGLSPKPWFQEVVDRYGAPPRQNQHQYEALVQGRRLAVDVLNEQTTRPIRLHLNFDTLDKEKVQASPVLKDRYCFRAGDWFKVGFPTTEKPTTRAHDDCGDRTKNVVTGDRWCKCLDSDVISAKLKSFVKEATAEAIQNFTEYVRVRPVQGNLSFRNWEGSYPGMWKRTGQTGSYCDPDCQKGLHVVVPESFCTEGLTAADAVVSVSMPPPSPGVGGAGTYCSADQNGRPTHLVFQWHRRPTVSELNLRGQEYTALKASWRGLVLHEVIHGLGFGAGIWQNTYGSDGKLRNIIQQRQVTDNDGTNDMVYHFVQGSRTYDVAKQYFGCPEDTSWQGLPLMSFPPSGRDTHHETRVMRDDVMSYGDGLQAVSSITLASLEDTGHYLANYNISECIFWGRGRGCSFVSSRCQVRDSDGLFVSGTKAAAKCDRMWTTKYSSANREALEKCAQLTCESRLESGEARCDAECFTGEDTSLSCQQASPGEVAAAGSPAWAADLASDLLKYDGTFESALALAAIAAAPLLFLSVCCLGKVCFCPSENSPRSRLIFYVLTLLGAGVGLSLIGMSGAALANLPEMQNFFGMPFEYPLAAGSVIFLVECFGMFAVSSKGVLKMTIYGLVRTFQIATLIFTVGFFVRFAGDMDSLVESMMTQVGVTPPPSKASILDNFQDEFLSQMQALSCNSYKVCCEDKALLDLRVQNGAPRQCKVAHAGTADTASFILSDPSHPDFCRLLAGTDNAVAFPPIVCSWMEGASNGGFSVTGCQQDYCVKGLEGFENFLTVVVLMYSKNVELCGMLIGFFIVLQLVQLANLYYIRKHVKRQLREIQENRVRGFHENSFETGVVPRHKTHQQGHHSSNHRGHRNNTAWANR